MRRGLSLNVLDASVFRVLYVLRSVLSASRCESGPGDLDGCPADLCWFCPEGSQVTGTQTGCDSCEVGKYRDTSLLGQNQCLGCPGGEVGTARDKCTLCGPGTYSFGSRDNCISCYQPEFRLGATRRRGPSNTECTRCDNTFQPVEGQDDCEESHCPVDQTHLDLTHLLISDPCCMCPNAGWGIIAHDSLGGSLNWIYDCSWFKGCTETFWPDSPCKRTVGCNPADGSFGMAFGCCDNAGLASGCTIYMLDGHGVEASATHPLCHALFRKVVEDGLCQGEPWPSIPCLRANYP